MPKVPFIANTADNTHCVQAAFAMMIKYFMPEYEADMQLLDKMSHKIKDRGTTWFPMIKYLNSLGLETRFIENFDYHAFYRQGKNYLLKIYEPEIANWYWNYSNLPQVRKLVPRAFEHITYEQRAANLKDVEQLLEDNWLVGIDVNVRVFNEKAGFSSHMVVVYEKYNEHFWLHDPGLPAHPERKVSSEILNKSWQYAGKSNTALVAIRK